VKLSRLNQIFKYPMARPLYTFKQGDMVQIIKYPSGMSFSDYFTELGEPRPVTQERIEAHPCRRIMAVKEGEADVSQKL
jgi:hypothetical protein